MPTTESVASLSSATTSTTTTTTIMIMISGVTQPLISCLNLSAIEAMPRGSWQHRSAIGGSLENVKWEMRNAKWEMGANTGYHLKPPFGGRCTERKYK